MVNPSNRTDWLSRESLSTHYGLTTGQTRVANRRVENGIWCNHHWRMLGWGDLASDDLLRIAKRIPFGELFVVVNGHIHPIVYKAANCSWLVERGSIYRIMSFTTNLSDEKIESLEGVRIHYVTRATAGHVIDRFQRLNRR